MSHAETFPSFISFFNNLFMIIYSNYLLFLKLTRQSNLLKSDAK